MSLIIEEAVSIFSEPEVIWELLAAPERWPDWWKDCVAAIPAGNRLDEGTEIELVLRPRLTKVTFRPVIDLWTVSKDLSLTHLSPFSQWTVAWNLQPRPDSTRVSVRGVFKGSFFFFLRVLQQGQTPRLVLQRQLRGLKKAARMAR